MSDELRSHLRYPEDLFRVQANMFGGYHVTNPDTFYASTDAWDIAQDPGTGRVSAQLRLAPDTGTASGEPATGQDPVTGVVTTRTRLERIEPTYLLLRLPGEEELSFTILQPFVPQSENDRQINARLGGRNLYWNDTDGHVWEILTVSYARSAPAPTH